MGSIETIQRVTILIGWISNPAPKGPLDIDHSKDQATFNIIMSSSQPVENKTAGKATEEVQENAQEAQKAETKRENFFETIKRKLFPNARGRDKPVEVSSGTAPTTQPAAATPTEAAAPAQAEATPPPTEAAASTPATPAEEKKPGLLDRIKDMFKSKKDKEPAAQSEVSTPAAATTAAQAEEPTAAQTVADTLQSAPLQPEGQSAATPADQPVLQKE